VAAPEASDSLRLTGEAAGLQTLQREMSSAPAIDQGRVQAVRESLQNGSYRINPEAIADRMIQLDQQLAG
jgi:negative regulator of flagellin synthesis FlgM